MNRRIFLAAIACLPFVKKTSNNFSHHIQKIKLDNLSRENIMELGRKGPYCRYKQIPCYLPMYIPGIPNEKT